MNPRVFTSGELGELLSLVQIHKLDTLNNCFKSVGQATAGGPGGFIDTLVDNIRLAFPGLATNSILFCLLQSNPVFWNRLIIFGALPWPNR